MSAGLPPPVPIPPRLLWISGEERRPLTLWRAPFSVGRRHDQDLVLGDPRVSRQHAEIVQAPGPEGVEYWVRDLGSRHGTWVNGQRVENCLLHPGDRVEFGTRTGDTLVFEPVTGAAQEFLQQMAALEQRGPESDLEKLTVFLDLARRLHSGNMLEEVLATLLDATLRLTGAERGFVFLRRSDGTLAPVAGRSSSGEPLAADNSISRSIIEEASCCLTEFLITDTLTVSMVRERESIFAHDLRMILCLPLRQGHTGAAGDQETVMGVIYFDSHIAGCRLSTLSRDILRAIATEAAALIENARLMEAETQAMRYRQELEIAAAIQQELLPVQLPHPEHAAVRFHCLPCHEVGGDFIDAVEQPDALAIAVADVSGKGISAALLASTLQGMIHAQLHARLPLDEIAAALHAFLRERQLEDRFVTLILARLEPAGHLQWLNCGHVPPLLIQNQGSRLLTEGTLPLGLPLPPIGLSVQHLDLSPGERLLLITDGVTDSEQNGEFFGDDRLLQATRGRDPFRDVLSALHDFRKDAPLEDDCTVLELHYRGIGESLRGQAA